jgi:cytochrome P450
LGNFLALRGDFLHALCSAHHRLGDVVRLSIWKHTLYSLAHPDAVQDVLQRKLDVYVRPPRNILSLLIGNGLLASSGDLWRSQRRLIQPALARPQVAAKAGAVITATQELLDAWRPHAASGASLDVAEEMWRLTLSIAGRALFGAELTGEAEDVGPALRIVLKHANDSGTSILRLPPHWPLPKNRRFQRALRALDQLVFRLIAERRANPRQGEDVLSRLISTVDQETGAAMDDRQLRDEVMTLLLAGHETTANGLAWTLYLLATHPEIAEKLAAEVERAVAGRIPACDDLPSLTYAGMVVDEAMRVYPPIPVIGRAMRQDDTVGGFELRAGSAVLVSPFITHRHAGTWTDPERFDPERFAPGCAANRHRFAYFPFGGGPHLCVGKHFALVEMVLIVAAVAQRYRLRAVPGHPVEPEAMISLRPRHGLRMTLEARQ